MEKYGGACLFISAAAEEEEEEEEEEEGGAFCPHAGWQKDRRRLWP